MRDLASQLDLRRQGRGGFQGIHAPGGQGAAMYLEREPGRAGGPSEDRGGAADRVAVMLDGLPEGPETGYIHGTPWAPATVGRRGPCGR